MDMKKQSAFSLLELSIVLVIIGLIAGGIVAGSSMIRAAEIRSVMTDLERFKTSNYTFRDKYLGLPGDLKNATAFWGEAHATPATCRTTASTGTETCNGDGNGRLETITGSSERYRSWQQLANAELISGTYTGVSGPGNANTDANPGENVPLSKVGGSGYHVGYYAIQSGSSYYFDGVFGGNIIVYGNDGGVGSIVQNPVLTPKEAWSVDKKIDDGRSGLGSIVTWKGTYSYNSGGVTCATVDDPNTSEYNLTEDAIACPLWFDLGI